MCPDWFKLCLCKEKEAFPRSGGNREKRFLDHCHKLTSTEELKWFWDLFPNTQGSFQLDFRCYFTFLVLFCFYCKYNQIDAESSYLLKNTSASLWFRQRRIARHCVAAAVSCNAAGKWTELTLRGSQFLVKFVQFILTFSLLLFTDHMQECFMHVNWKHQSILNWKVLVDAKLSLLGTSNFKANVLFTPQTKYCGRYRIPSLLPVF